MLGKLTLRNYRCFDWHNPVTIEFQEGFIAYVGINNSGKSALLKSVYELRHLWNAIPAIFSEGAAVSINPIGISDGAELANDNDPTRFELELEISPHQSLIDLNSNFYVNYLKIECNVISGIAYLKALSGFHAGIQKTLNISNIDAYKKDFRGQYVLIENNTVYTQLIADFCNTLAQAKYFPAFRNAINEGANDYYDLPVGTALVQRWDSWKAGNNRAQKIAISKVEAQIAELLGFQSLQINADQTQKTLDVIINGRPQKLYEVGSGVAQLIIVLAAGLIYKPSFILIDEPELNLHPSLQLKFLMTLGGYANFGLLFSTHSLGLARSSAQKIFSVVKKAGATQVKGLDDSPDCIELLGELGYSGRLELGCEEILLLEGPTEILCFQALLRKVGKDQKYLLMSLGGSSQINEKIGSYLSELTRVIDKSKIHIFVDSERDSANGELLPERQLFKNACEDFGVHVALTDRKATENYFTQSAIDRALGVGYTALGEFEKLKKSAKPWSKAMNWKIATEIDLNEIKETDLARFLKVL